MPATSQRCDGSAPVGNQMGVTREKGLALLRCAFLGGSPNGKAERDLVHEVSEVVDQVESIIIDTTQQVPEEVAGGIDSPTGSNDQTHGTERALHVLIRVRGRFPRLACKNLEQDEEPSAHAECKAKPGVQVLGLTTVAEGLH